MERRANIYVAGAETLIGAAIVRELERQGYMNIIGGSEQAPDLTDAALAGASLHGAYLDNARGLR